MHSGQKLINLAMAQQQWLYFEKQTAGLCGMHCLNTLLQQWAFNEIQLAQARLQP